MGLIWKDKQMVAQVNAACEEACREGAELVAADMRRLVPTDKGDLKSTIKTRKSRFVNGGWLAGVFYEDAGKWEDTMGARAIFVEYGHAAPGAGRGSGVNRGNIVKSIPAKPFIRPALRKNKAKINRNFENKLK